MTPFPGTDTIIELTYLIATALFVMSLKWMSSPTTARHGVWAGELGMLLAIVGTLLNRSIVDYKWVAIALVLISVFVPVAFLGGLTGQFYKQFALTLSVSVLISALIALTFTLVADLFPPSELPPNRTWAIFQPNGDREDHDRGHGLP